MSAGFHAGLNSEARDRRIAYKQSFLPKSRDSAKKNPAATDSGSRIGILRLLPLQTEQACAAEAIWRLTQISAMRLTTSSQI